MDTQEADSDADQDGEGDQDEDETSAHITRRMCSGSVICQGVVNYRKGMPSLAEGRAQSQEDCSVGKGLAPLYT